MWQIEGMFQARFNPASGVLVSEQPPPPVGPPGMPVPGSAEFVGDGLNRVVVRTQLPAEGYLALMDTYTPDWQVDVDGMPAPLMRANGLFRAVHLVAGTHVVTFTYHPSMFYLGARITAATAAALSAVVRAGPAAREGRRGGCSRRPETREARRSPLAPFFVAFVGLLPVLGVFSLHNIFFIRDLSFFFWSRHMRLRHTLLSGQAPWWDPYVASGQSAIADALNQTLMPLDRRRPAAAVRRRVVQPVGGAADPDRGAGHVRLPAADAGARRRGPRRLRVRAVAAPSCRCSTLRTCRGRSRSCRGCMAALASVRGARCEVRRHQCRHRIRVARAVWRAGDVGGHGGPGVLLRALDARR